MTEARNLPVFSAPIRALISREDEMITAADIAPIVRMSPDVIIKYAKENKWPSEICNCIVSGEGPGAHVKFFRVDFLRKGGWIPPEVPKNDTLTGIHEELIIIRQLLTSLVERMEAIA